MTDRTSLATDGRVTEARLTELVAAQDEALTCLGDMMTAEGHAWVYDLHSALTELQRLRLSPEPPEDPDGLRWRKFKCMTKEWAIAAMAEAGLRYGRGMDEQIDAMPTPPAARRGLTKVENPKPVDNLPDGKIPSGP